MIIDTINEAVHFIVEPLQNAKKRYMYNEVLYMPTMNLNSLITRHSVYHFSGAGHTRMQGRKKYEPIDEGVGEGRRRRARF